MKIYNAVFEITPMDIESNLNIAVQHLNIAIKDRCDIIIFPQFFLLGSSLGVLKDNIYMHELYNTSINTLINYAKENDIYIFADILKDNHFKSSFFYKGKILSVDKIHIDGLTVNGTNDIDFIFKNQEKLYEYGDMFLINISKPTVAGEPIVLKNSLVKISNLLNISFIVNMGGAGFSSHPFFFAPMAGYILKDNNYIVYDYSKIINMKNSYNLNISNTPVSLCETLKFNPPLSFELKREYNDNPLIPVDISKKEYLLQLFDFQSASLYIRMKNINCKDVVINLSGGLDSTIALLVTVNAFNMLNIPKSGIHVITMPGFGTGNTTKNLAYSLAEILKLNIKTIDITNACKNALSDTNHDFTVQDIAFENVQARVRTLYALQLANSYPCGLMIGTGDLSESALGFSTYGGDQLASYNVNCCISKTVIRSMLYYVTSLPEFASAKDIVNKILDIPISPELLPGNDEILQRTEDILAPYKLIDFFIFCFIIKKLSPHETVKKAQMVFKEEFSIEYLKEKLNMFYKKYAIGQFKRSSAPESAFITKEALYGVSGYYPSDGKPIYIL